MPIWRAEKANNAGAFSKTILIDPAAPEQAKNIWTKITPRAVPVSLRRAKNFGNSVADTTVKADIKGREDVPTGSQALVKNAPAVTNEDAIDMEIAREGSVMVDGDLSSSTASSDIVDCCSSASPLSLSSPFATTVPPSPALAIQNKKAKYIATTTLSAAMAAATASPLMLSVSATATKLMAPPMCLAANAHATRQPTSVPMFFSGMIGKATSVATTVAKAPTPKAARRVPVSLMTRLRSESKSSRGTASGTKKRLTTVYTGE
mmetsp:Transcript_2302/g.4941  ORF Transcript_2302/g.4941 Transcript_2302/m.4941 type:complete len:263 (-) Transcript_2302:602-1390(-)